jgi:Rps23 Pro-64 3,4-dihydroxylase Tpa1-like proline 4-hydroxylase
MNGKKLIELKEELFETGYVSFNLKDISLDLYSKLESLIPIGTLRPSDFTNLKASIINFKNKPDPLYPNDITDKSFEELKTIKDDILNRYLNSDDYGLDQVWYYKNAANHHTLDFVSGVYSLFYNLTRDRNCGSNITLYDDGCFLRNHADANDTTTNRTCALLIYLSNDWVEGKGGELVIDKKVVVPPIYGNVVILDFTKHNPEHMVNRVIGFNRYCLINFCAK